MDYSNNTYTHNHDGAFNMMETPKDISLPSIDSSAMLVDLSVSKWSGRKKDKNASKQVTSQNNAHDNVANVSKKLLADCAELKAIHSLADNARNNIHYKYTMPWLDSGARILPTRAYVRYHEEMTKVRDEFYRLVEVFLSNYDWEITRAQAALGNMFDDTEYPTSRSLRDKFSMSINYMPLPSGGDFRIDIGHEAINEVKAQYQKFYDDKVQQAMKDIWQRVHTALARMSERLDFESDDNKKIFKNTLVTNITELVDVMDICNVTGDTQMTALKQKLEDTFHGLTADDLRKNDNVRVDTKKAVDDIINNLPSLDM